MTTFTPARFLVRGLLRDMEVEGWKHGDWAVHRQLANPELFCITHLPLGLSLPLVWASFRYVEQALAATAEIARLKNSWDRIEQVDLTKQLEGQLKNICARYGAIEGLVQLTAKADEDVFGMPRHERVNGYQHPGVS